MNNSFIPGDKVMLVSGGPEMIIRDLHYDVLTNKYHNNIFDCIWFAKNNEGKEEIHYCPYDATKLLKLNKTPASL